MIIYSAKAIDMVSHLVTATFTSDDPCTVEGVLRFTKKSCSECTFPNVRGSQDARPTFAELLNGAIYGHSSRDCVCVAVENARASIIQFNLQRGDVSHGRKYKQCDRSQMKNH